MPVTSHLSVPNKSSSQTPIREKGEGQKLLAPYLWTVTLVGALALLHCISRFPLDTIDTPFIILVLFTLGLGSRLSVRIPRSGGTISVSDTFICVALFRYGVEAAVVLAAADALLTSTRFAKSKLTIAFNGSVYACSTFAAGSALILFFGNSGVPSFFYPSPLHIVAIGVVALAQFSINSGLIATAVALAMRQPIWRTWRQKFLWTSLTYFAGASGAAIVVALSESFGTYALITSLPIVVIVYFTYTTYLKNVEFSAAQAEQAHRHVEELSHYIAEQERIRDQFSQLEKMSALGQLASGVAHNFNNSLASIRARVELTLQHVPDSRTRHDLELVIRSAEDAAMTVRRIQDFARRSSDNLELVDVKQLLLDVSEITRPRWKDSSEAQEIHITLELHSDGDSYVMGNASELREVLINMIFNALDAMPSGGRLRLVSDKVNSSVIISISDTGLGMTPETRSRVFEPFFTTKGEMGVGLGLAVSYGIISRHGGTIEVDSEPQRGSTFQIQLPVAEGRNSDATQQEGKLGTKAAPDLVPASVREAQIETSVEITLDSNRDNESRASSVGRLQAMQNGPPAIRVLVVDDELLVLTAYRDILLDLGYEVNTATSGSEALEVAKTFCPDILLADNNMPKMSGLQTIQELQQIAPDALSILTTGYSDIAIVTKALRQSVFDFLLKPVSLENLTHSIQRAVMQLEARERERRQKDFLSIVSHELRAPLQAPLRYLENILTSDEDQLNEKQRSMLQRAAKGIKAEVRLINNLLDLQYLESGRFNIKLREYSLRSAVQDVAESFFLQAADLEVQILWNPPGDLFLAQLDPEQTRQAIANVLNNAIQHSPAHGAVKLRLFRRQNKVSIMVRDSGPGIAEPYLERIFEKSFQIPATVSKKGLGVGLYIAREIVRAHGGEILVKSKLERGSIFVIRLPCAATV